MASKTYNVVVLGGDGIGPEVVEQALRVLEVVSSSNRDVKIQVEKHDFGGIAIDNHGDPLPESTLAACKAADAILMGSVGGPKWGHVANGPEKGLLRLRKSLGLYANIRPSSFASESLLSASPLKPDIARGTNYIVVRELIGGLYFGKRQEATSTTSHGEDGVAWDTMIYSVPEIQRITRVAAQIALAANPPLPIHSIDKANVLASSRLWRKVVTETIQNEYPNLSLDHQLVDSAAMIMVANPRKLNGVILTENMFGDILSDESSVIPGSLGLLPSASLAGFPSATESAAGLYEPIHGSAPDIAGQGIANPIGTILSLAMLLRYSLRLENEAQAVEAAVRKVLDTDDIGGFGYRTKDLGGDRGTKEIGDKIVEVLKGILVN
ncbi:3-isopropylmalate dehydrogenase [Tulasnella sp. 419]|nr:3-isopropylmalate dehydrogenase [Tulasnella sp. 418]KAG8960383.1 3-isopropylmalate dehydrogenase [Tulasnella sp. 419]